LSIHFLRKLLNRKSLSDIFFPRNFAQSFSASKSEQASSESGHRSREQLSATPPAKEKNSPFFPPKNQNFGAPKNRRWQLICLSFLRLS
jgi:hypothetical protein